MAIRVFVDGHEGTTGLQIHERLAGRDDVELLVIDPARRKDPAARAELLNAADVAFLCLPDAAAREAVALVENTRTLVIDASTAHRILPDWAYGVPELAPEYRERIRTFKRIAVGGCHATAFLLAVRPLVRAGLIPLSYPLSCFSLTGYSGGGKKMIAEYENDPPASLTAPRPYALGLMHKHLPEMRVYAGLGREPVFNPVVSNFYKGLAACIPLVLEALPGPPAAAQIHEVLSAAYAGERFVRVLPLGEEENAPAGYMDIQTCNGTNLAEIAVFSKPGQAVVVTRLDNLGKGASGAAIQCMNLHLGLDEGAGLD